MNKNFRQASLDLQVTDHVFRKTKYSMVKLLTEHYEKFHGVSLEQDLVTLLCLVLVTLNLIK